MTGLAIGGVGLALATRFRELAERFIVPIGRPLVDEQEYVEFLAAFQLQHITPQEIIRPHRNIRGGVRNQLPPRYLWKNIRKPLQVAEELRRRLGVPLNLINSAYRSPAYNAQCPGAAKRSYHLRNMALDLMFDCSSTLAAEVAWQLREEGFFKGGVGIYPTFIHIDTRGRNANWGKA